MIGIVATNRVAAGFLVLPPGCIDLSVNPEPTFARSGLSVAE